MIYSSTINNVCFGSFITLLYPPPKITYLCWKNTPLALVPCRMMDRQCPLLKHPISRKFISRCIGPSLEEPIGLSPEPLSCRGHWCAIWRSRIDCINISFYRLWVLIALPLSQKVGVGSLNLEWMAGVSWIWCIYPSCGNGDEVISN